MTWADIESETHSVMSNSLGPHGILQARILGWVAFPFSRGSSQPRDQTHVSLTAGRFFTNWIIKVALSIQRNQLDIDLEGWVE